MRSIQNQLNAWMDGNALTDLVRSDDIGIRMHPLVFSGPGGFAAAGYC